MYLPQLPVRKQRYQKQTVSFRGLNYGTGVTDGQLEDSRNLTTEQYPCMTPRRGRANEGEYSNATAVYYRNHLFAVDGTELYVDGAAVATVSPGEKLFATINTKTVIMPDMVYYDSETQKLLSLTAEYTTDTGAAELIDKNALAIHAGRYSAAVESSGNKGGSSGSDSAWANKSDLSYYEDDYPFTGKIASVSVNAETGEITFGTKSSCPKAENIETGMLFYDTELGIDGVTKWGKVTKHYLSWVTPVGPGGTASTKKQKYGFDYDVYTVTGADYEAFPGFEALGFAVGDSVELSGMTTYPDENGSYIIRGFGAHTTDDGTKLPTIIFDNDVFAKNGTEAGTVTIRRKAPKLSVICESDNRIWGAEGNTIYASALGDPTNFYTYDGVDTDSYAVAVASDGKLTGCCGYGKSVLFFKEDRMIKILGDYPSQYTLYEYQVPGVKDGSQNSLCNISDNIYYHGREGIYRYSGGSPELISDVFGMHRYENAAAGAAGGRYYISMHERGTGGEWGLWVYDTALGLWVQEDGTEARCFAKNGEKLFYIDGVAQKLVCVNPEESDELIGWSGTLCRMDETVHNRKCYSKLYLRGELLTDEAWMQAEISCDGEPFRRVYTSRDKRTKTLVIPILPTRCDSFRIRLSGEGPFIIRSLVREYSTGSEY